MSDEMSQPTVSLVTTDWAPAFPRIARWLGSGLRDLGVRADIVHLGGPRSVSRNGSCREIRLGSQRARSALLPLAHYLQHEAPLLTIATPGGIGMLALLAGRLGRQAVVPWEATIPRLDAPDIPLRLRPLRWTMPFFYRAAPRVAAVSEAVRDALVKDLMGRVPPEHVVVLPNPLDSDEVRRLSTPPAPRSRGLRICAVGRLCNAKGFDVLIDALALARRRLGPSWEALVIGDGLLRADLEARARRARLDDHVFFMGMRENPYPLLASADIAVQPSRWEGFSLAMGEALCLGVPLVTTTCPGGYQEVLDGGRFGVLVPPDDAAALAEAITALAEDGERRRDLSEQGAQRMCAYTPVRTAERLLRLVTEIGAERGLTVSDSRM